MAFISNGTTILDAGAFNVNLGSMVLISEQTASSSANVSFTSGIDSSYPIYKFEFIDIHAGTDQVNFTFQGSTNGGSSYGVTMTTTFFRAVHGEDGSSGTVSYETDKDLAQSTSFQRLTHVQSSDNDGNSAGTLFLYNPSSTTFVKHFMSRTSLMQDGNYAFDSNIAGYFNTTSSINAIQFKMSSGNIDAGTIKLYGIKDS
jgi:hypothetical protein